MAALLAGLEPIERTVLLCFHRDGRPVAAIARELRLPVGTVKSHLSRGRSRLAALLTPEVVNDER
jgi:RNA polymerase sigma-70 factor (ECF subfamily)